MAAHRYTFADNECYFAFNFGWVHCRPDERTGLLPAELRCVGWRGTSNRPGQVALPDAERFIRSVERSQAEGQIDRITAWLPALDDLTGRLEARAAELLRLAERARMIRASHEPAADERRTE